MFATAQPPARATTSMTLSFGPIPIELSVYTGTEETRVARKEFTADGHEVGRQAYDKLTGEVVDSAAVLRKAEASNGVWVDLTDDEISSCTSEKGQAEIVAFVPLKDLDQYLTKNVVQVRPKRTKGKVNVSTQYAFHLMLTAMRKRKVAALVKVALRGPAGYALITPEGDMRLVYTADAVREPMELGFINPAKKEVDLALAVIDTLVGIDTPVITDDTAPVVQAYVDSKAAGKPVPVKPDAPAVPVDIMAAIEASIAQKKGAAA